MDSGTLTRVKQLSPAKQVIARYLAEGLSNRQIGEEIGLSEKTVKNHLAQIYKAFGVGGRGEFIATAFRLVER